MIHFHINRRNDPRWVRAIKLYVRGEWREQQLAEKKTVFSTAACTYVTKEPRLRTSNSNVGNIWNCAMRLIGSLIARIFCYVKWYMH